MILLIIIFTINTKLQLEHIQSPLVAGHFYDVKKVDSLVYFVTLRGLEIYKWDIVNPQLILSFPTDGLAYGFDVVNNYAYIADYYRGLCIVDVSMPASPKMIGYYETGGKACDVAISNNYAYLADGENGLVILDILNPSAPYLIGHCQNIGRAFSITIEDTLAYVGVFDDPLKIINVTDPANPFVVGEFPPGGPGVYGIDALVDDTLAYVNCCRFLGDTFHLAVVNVKNPADPEFIAGVVLPHTNRGIEKHGKYVYTNAQNDGIYVIDVNDSEMPFVVGQYSGSNQFGYGFVVDDATLLVPHFLDGFSAADITNPVEPIKLYHHKNIVWRYFTVDDSLEYLYVVGHISDNQFPNHSILQVMDISNPASPVLCGNLPLSGRAFVYDNSVEYPYLVVTIRRGHPSSESLYTAVIDVSDPYNPELVRFIKDGGVTDMHLPYFYSLDATKIMIADVRSPLFWVDSLLLSTQGYDIVVYDTIAYVTVKDSFLILNVASKCLLGAYNHGKSYAVNISLDFPYLTIPYTPHSGSTYGFLLFDVYDPYSPSLVVDTCIFAPPVHPQSICIMGCVLNDTLLLWGRGDYGFDIWHVNYPDVPNRIITQETPNLATHCNPSGNSNIHVKNNVIFILDDGSLELYKLIYP